MAPYPLGLTFDDVLLIPQESDARPADVVLRTRLTKRITLELPILSSVMDTVTDALLAIIFGQFEFSTHISLISFETVLILLKIR